MPEGAGKMKLYEFKAAMADQGPFTHRELSAMWHKCIDEYKASNPPTTKRAPKLTPPTVSPAVPNPGRHIEDVFEEQRQAQRANPAKPGDGIADVKKRMAKSTTKRGPSSGTLADKLSRTHITPQAQTKPPRTNTKVKVVDLPPPVQATEEELEEDLVETLDEEEDQEEVELIE